VPVQLEQVVQEVSQIIVETFPKLVAFESHCATDLWDVIGDATQLHQVLLNLCVNARDAMPKGGKLSIRVENVELDELYARENMDASPGQYVIIKVTDTGAGMPKEIQDRIFEPFFTTKGPSKGTGLGLSTCLAIVKSHGGFITCYSEPGRGSAFKVYLPVGTAIKQPTRPSCLPQDVAVINGHNELVLVAEDEESIREIAKLILERSGYRVLTAVNGEEALVIYQQYRNEIAVVLMDISMPVMDGEAAIAVLRSINPALKIIVTSGLGFRPRANGDTGFEHRYILPKPYSAESLLQTLHAVLTANE